MKYIRNKIVMFVGLVIMTTVMSSSYATYYHARDERRLNHMLDKYDLVVVLFYNKKMAHAAVKQTFKQLSRGYSYHQADVAFVGIDVAHEDGAAIAREYGVRGTPALILFQEGRLVTGKDRAPAVATDVKSASDMRLFINKYFGDRIEDEIRDKEERERCRGRRSRRSGFHFGISYGYPYYPYYGYPFGYSYGYPIIYW